MASFTLKSLDEIVQGTPATITVNFTNADGSVIDLSNDSFFMTVKEYKDQSDDDAVMKHWYVMPSGDADGVNGVAKFSFSADDTDVSPQNYVYDIKWVRDGSGSGEPHVVAMGNWSIIQKVTTATEVS